MRTREVCPVALAPTPSQAPSPLRLDLACGPKPRAGYQGVDIRGGKYIDHVVDLETHPWPFRTESVGEVWCEHFVEHVRDLVGFANDLWRILVPGGKAVITHPYEFHRRAWRDPTHVRALNEESWLYWDARWRTEYRVHHVMSCDFAVSVQPIWSPEWVVPEISDEQRLQAMGRLVNVVEDLVVTLVKRGS